MSRRPSFWMTVFVLVSFLAVLPACAQQKVLASELKKQWPLTLAKGSTVVVKIPTHYWQDEKDQRKGLNIWSPFKNEKGPSGTGLAYFVDVQDLLNQSNWASDGFPFCREFALTKILELTPIFRSKKLPYTEIELQSGNVYLRLHFAHSSSEADALNSDFHKLVVSGNWEQFESSEDFRKNVFAAQDAKIFVGPLNRSSYPVKLALFHMACYGQSSVATETFKNKTYFAVTLPSDGNVYNANVLNSSARVATIINGQVVDRIKTFKFPAQESGIDGLKFATVIIYRNFVNESANHTDQLEVYLPIELVVKFVNADITSQELIDGGIVLLNGNRIRAPLAGG